MLKIPSVDNLVSKVSDAVGSSQTSSGVSDAERAKIEAEARKKYEAELKAKEDAERARKYAEIEKQEKAEKERLLAEQKQQEAARLEEQKAAEERARVEAQQRAEAEQKAAEREQWAREEASKKAQKEAEEARMRAQVEKEMKAQAKAEKKAKSHGLRNAGIVLVIILILLGAAYVTLITGNETDLPAHGYQMSCQASYNVAVPDNTPVKMLSIPMSAISSGNDVTLIINNDRNTIGLGKTASYPAKHMTVACLGIKLIDCDYQIDATYRGVVANKDDFVYTIKSSSAIPSWLIGMLSSGGIEVRTP